MSTPMILQMIRRKYLVPVNDFVPNRSVSIPARDIELSSHDMTSRRYTCMDNQIVQMCVCLYLPIKIVCINHFLPFHMALFLSSEDIRSAS